jgi:ABC-type molybdate transport system substrate-binding protein
MPEVEYPVIPSERGDDLHHLEVLESADLVLFMAGNQFMVMEELLAAFRRRHPEVRSVFYETLPPGLELRQILAGGARFRDRLLDVYPDVYTSVSEAAMQRLVESGHIEPDGCQLYLHNRLTLMVPAGNPAGITTVQDMGRKTVRISQPDPANEDIAAHIIEMYRRAGGAPLVHRIMEEKLAEGTTLLTVVHHRETPLRIARKAVDVGPVWATEAVYAANTGLAFDTVEPGPALDQRDRIGYFAGRLKHAPHPQHADAFLNFLLSAEARNIYADHGFVPPGSPS